MHVSAKRCCFTALLVATACSSIFAQEKKPAPRISAPVYYEDMMLVVVTETGVAAIKFTDRVEFQNEKGNCDGIKYRYRFLLKERPKELTGTGEVYEVRDAKTGEYIEHESKLFIEAGGVRMQWSIGGLEKGWIYYKPEQMKVHLANSDRFENRAPTNFRREEQALDLSRFLPKQGPATVKH